MTDTRHQLGRLGERLAAEHLEAQGWEILERNYRRKGAEIDIDTNTRANPPHDTQDNGMVIAYPHRRDLPKPVQHYRGHHPRTSAQEWGVVERPYQSRYRLALACQASQAALVASFPCPTR